MATPTVSELRRARFARRLPVGLSELVGPAHGTVRLPLHLAEGMREDLAHYPNHDLLITLWPVLRTLVSRDIRDTWENAFSELAHPTRATA